MKTPVAILDRLFGRKPQDSASLSARLDATHIALDEARQRQASADERCKAAMVSADRPAFLSAKADGEAAEFDAGVALGEIEALSVALAAALEAEQAAAKAAAFDALVERRGALADRLETDWREAAAVLAEIIGEARTLQRDCADGGFDKGIDRLPEIGRFDVCAESVGTLSKWLGDALSVPPTVPESPKERDSREYKEARARREAEREAESARNLEEGRKRFLATQEAERQAEAERERNPFYPSLRDSDSAR